MEASVDEVTLIRDRNTGGWNPGIFQRGAICIPFLRYQQKEKGSSSKEIIWNLLACLFIGESRKFAFVRFTSVGHAIQFVEKHYPHFYMGQCRVRVDYCHKDGGREDKIEWRCPRVCTTFACILYNGYLFIETLAVQQIQ